MSRVIKFRGKRPDGSWNYGRSIIFKQSGAVLIKGAKVDPDTVGQFTGLHDANGKEIYEGDLVEFTYKKLNKYGSAFSTTQKVIGEVATDEYGNHYISSCNLAFHISNIIERKAKAIGNIHDNPELLKGG